MKAISSALRSHIERRLFVYPINKYFHLPSGYKPNTEPIKKLPVAQCLKVWLMSLKPNRLEEIQDELVHLMYPLHAKDNHGVSIEKNKIKIDQNNHINEISFEVTNNLDKPIKHLVFIHGYGASLGCFARNFQIINKLKGLKYNYKVHFLDNISFGLSSNPRINSNLISHWKIPRCVPIKLNDPDQPTDLKKLHRKYYKLIESYSCGSREFQKYQKKFKPIIEDIEAYYLTAIDKWRIASKLDKIDFLTAHSFGAYWSASYAVKYPHALNNLILLSPVGLERHVHAITNNTISDKSKEVTLKPTLDPSSFRFLSRLPILSKQHVRKWYHIQPYLPRLLRFMGPFGVQKFYDMWYLKLFKINRLISKKGGAENVFCSSNDLVYGTNKECHLIVEYLYNSMSQGSNSDIYIKNLLTPSTVSKWPLYDKFEAFASKHKEEIIPFGLHLSYGQFDFMNSEAGLMLCNRINEISGPDAAHFHEISESGHNLYIDNPMETNALIAKIVEQDELNG
ncbi:uncharacterized protein PRCAT00000984001 [Priceomyces carsonii]|uniref:uncharacterized protein n=1 Tax=Priceomyces carsonii TaxID=28549 RepID=UPI002EDA75C6|nr:unnamed protein product [Priceomyces carsonii]